METYLVGGAVRDQLLELPVYDRDWVVVGATAAEMLAAGYTRADAEFPVFIHPETGDEFALARIEQKIGVGYKGFSVYAGTDVTLEQDLLRRDLTINALALDAEGRLIDVCHGREDLDAGLLRHITPAFDEDPVRLLRIARFAAKLGQWGFRVAHGTQGLMQRMAAGDDLLALKQERVFQELWKALSEPQPWRFFEVLQRCGALRRLLPELSDVMGRLESHQSIGEDSMAALKRAVKLSDDPMLRFVVVMVPAAGRTEDVNRFISGLRTGRQAKEHLHDLLELAPLLEHGPDAGKLLRIIKRLRPDRQPQRFAAFVLAFRALWPERGVEMVKQLQMAREVVASVDVAEMRTQGLEGSALGAALLKRQLEGVHERLSGES